MKIIFKYKLWIPILSGLFLINCKTLDTSSVTVANPSEKIISVDEKWSEKMALTLIDKYPKAYMLDDKTAPKWDYVHGLVMTAFEEIYKTTKDEKYLDYVKDYADTLIEENGTILTYKPENYNIDMIIAGNHLFYLYDKTSKPQYLKAIQTLRQQLNEHPRTTEGGFWHKKVYPNQMWLDGLYMGAPFYAQYTSRYENNKNLDDVALQFELIQKHLLDKKTGLLYHGWDESRAMFWADKTTGLSPNFWSRSLGWYAMALVDVLDFFPENHPKRAKLLQYFTELSEALIKYQDKSGLWYQVTDLGHKEGNYLEASGTVMFTYAFAKGANKGYLPKKYKTAANKAFDGMVRDLIKVSPEGYITITQVCAVAGLGGKGMRDGSFEYYINERKKDNDPKATGPFILAALQLGR